MVWEGKKGAAMMAKPQLTYTNSLGEFHVEACARSMQLCVCKTSRRSIRSPYPKALPRAVMMPPVVITTVDVGLACSIRWLAMKAPVFIASWFKAAHRIKIFPALTAFWLSS